MAFKAAAPVAAAVAAAAATTNAVLSGLVLLNCIHVEKLYEIRSEIHPFEKRRMEGRERKQIPDNKIGGKICQNAR